MTAKEMNKRIGTVGYYQAENFTLKVTIQDLMESVGEGTLCLITASEAEGQAWVPLRKFKEVG